MTKLKTTFAILVGSSFSLFSYAGEWSAPLDGIVKQVITKGYESYSASSLQLTQQAKTLCQTPSQEALQKARVSFEQNVLDWQQIQWLNFGPVTYFMRYYAFEYWPDKKGVGQRQLRALSENMEALDKPKFWTSASIAVRGLTAIETLLYHPDFSPITSPNYCALLEHVTQHHLNSTNAVKTQWEESKAQDWIFEEEGSDFDAEKLAFEQFLQQWIEHMSAVKDSKLEVPIGYNSSENLKLAEFYRSELSLISMQQNLKTYRTIFHAGSPSLYDIAKEKLPTIASQLDEQLAENVKLVLQLPNNYYQKNSMSHEERVTLAKPLVESISKSQSLLTSMMTQLGFQIGFNSRDGD